MKIKYIFAMYLKSNNIKSMNNSKIKEEVKTVFDNSDKYSKRSAQKEIIVGKVNRALDYLSAEVDLLDRLSNCIYGSPIIQEARQFDENLYIVLTSADEYWRTVNLKSQNCFPQVSYNYEYQLLLTFSKKYGGENSQFADFAAKMLGGDFVKTNSIRSHWE